MWSGRSIRAAWLATIGAVAAPGTLGACGDDGNQHADASPDMAPGVCTEVSFDGELIDWDWTNAAQCGVPATLTVHGQATRTDSTNPNGRFGLCLPRQAETVVDVSFPAAANPCATLPGTYRSHVVLVAEQAVIDAGGFFSARAMTQERLTRMFTAIGQAYDAGKGQIVVHVAGTSSPVEVAADHAAVQHFDGAMWSPGDTGNDVFFPNVAPGATQVTINGGSTNVTAVADTFTYLTVVGTP
jgi:hypothetical protein